MLKIARPVSFLLLSVTLCSSGVIFAANETATPKVGISQQQASLKGVVEDELGPVAGASVVVKGTTNGTVTDMDGNFTLEVKKGECVAITGASGCGKTTLSKLLLGLYPLGEGDIRVNGMSMRESDLADLRRQIAYVPQEPYLFQGSIAENIRMGRPDATEKEIREAAMQAHAHDFIMEFPEGYDTTVGERGNNLSGGQRQRIAIARAILKDTSIILLDEATSALDNESEQAVNEALRNLQGQKTILMIAHRPSTIELADRVCTMVRAEL